MLIFNNQQQPAESITISAEKKNGSRKMCIGELVEFEPEISAFKNPGTDILIWEILPKKPWNGTRTTPVLED